MTMILDGTAGMTAPQGAVYNGLQMATTQASTSGTAIDFTGIPVWVRRVTVLFNGVSTSGTSGKIIQFGSGSITSSGYVSAGAQFNPNAGTQGADVSTAGFYVHSVAAADVIYGTYVMYNISGSAWVGNYTARISSPPVLGMGGGNVTLAGLLDRVRITTVNGTDTFDAGTINIMYE